MDHGYLFHARPAHHDRGGHRQAYGSGRLARPRALFAFSLEVCTEADLRLLDSGRYAQSAPYIKRLAEEHGFTVSLRTSQPIRKPIVGLLYVLARRP